MMTFEQLLPAEVPSHWPVCRDLLAKAFRYRMSAHSVDDYYNLLLNGNLQLFVVKSDATVIAAIVTSIDAGTNAKVCSILSLAGENIPLWIDLVDRHITDFANFHECNGIEWVGRPGFTKLVEGFVEDGRVFVKVLR